jgi:electron transfer flavoprotein alpha subunit
MCAINKNPKAPFFSISAYGIIGDVYQVVPLLIKEIKYAQETMKA